MSPPLLAWGVAVFISVASPIRVLYRTRGAAAPQSNDVDVGPDGLIYLLDRVNGFDILEFKR